MKIEIRGYRQSKGKSMITKGPWRVATTDDCSEVFKVDEQCGEYNGVAAGRGYSGNGFMLTGFIPREYVTLMAAAPELLEALQACFEVLDCHWMETKGEGIDPAEHTARHKARAAIKKAVDNG